LRVAAQVGSGRRWLRRDGGVVAGEIGGGGCVEGGRKIRVRISCVRWRR